VFVRHNSVTHCPFAFLSSVYRLECFVFCPNRNIYAIIASRIAAWRSRSHERMRATVAPELPRRFNPLTKRANVKRSLLRRSRRHRRQAVSSVAQRVRRGAFYPHRSCTIHSGWYCPREPHKSPSSLSDPFSVAPEENAGGSEK